MNEIYVVKKVFSKDGQEIEFYNLYVDLGYRQCTISKDKEMIKVICDFTDKQLYQLVVDKPLNVARLVMHNKEVK